MDRKGTEEKYNMYNYKIINQLIITNTNHIVDVQVKIIMEHDICMCNFHFRLLYCGKKK